ncbi:hypothetical protein [Sulfitobacter aestuariivivens]|uniref:Flagellar FliJ protein n=1 Tax=Sulfitobacter aestuariivivens TaxID=2766981 RepID=A0A927D6X2_9RHOB|nr:hypothetical protein [Sulfitobacter aestuariivivens]MBD3665511.1 hypothetical protein [Sulfitobacter aestuariivivens]
MTDASALTDLKTITEAVYAHRQLAFAKLVAREKGLRMKLANLDDVRLQASAATQAMHQMQSVGADVVWQTWTERTRTALNLQLAQVLAAKGHHLRDVRQAHGKMSVVNELQKERTAGMRRSNAQRQLEEAIALSIAGLR